MASDNKNKGSDFDAFLKTEGLLAEVNEAAVNKPEINRKDLRELRGKIKFYEGFDYKALRGR